MASAREADRSNIARPMMLWPEAPRSPSVGIVGATPTPSTDTHATARPAAACSRRCKERRRLSSGKGDGAYLGQTPLWSPQLGKLTRRAPHQPAGTVAPIPKVSHLTL